MSKKKPTVASFEVSEIAMHVYSTSGIIPVGAEVEIVEPLKRRDDVDGPVTRYYGVSYEGHAGTLYSMPDQLRKLDPPGDPSTLVQWSECPWQPKEAATR
jgi:hypothetical protein